MTTPAEYVSKRSAYSYPAVGLSGCSHNWWQVTFKTTNELDSHQNQLLLSAENDQAVLGYLSTIFWGFYSGKDGAVRSERARSRVKLAMEGRERRMTGVQERGVDFIASEIRAAHSSLILDGYADALTRLCGLPQLGLAFASKVCAFLVPAKCGVIDSVVAESCPQFGFSIDDKGNVKNTVANKVVYASYCAFLQEQACTLNSHGEQFRWKDRDNFFYEWRAVDVERALY